MLTGLETRLKRLFSSTGGKAVLEVLEREASQTERSLDLRHSAAARVEDARRRDREEKPALEAAVEKADAALAEARRRFEEAKRTRYQVGMALNGHRDHLRDEVRRGEAELRHTADPRLREALDRLYAASSHFHHLANRLLHLELRGEFLKAHYVATNQQEVDAMEARLNAALKTVDKWLLVPDPSEEDLLRVLEEANAAADAVALPDGGGR